MRGPSRVNRLLPPLLLFAVLGVVLFRAAQRPQRERMRAEIRAHWEDGSLAARKRTFERAQAYADAFEAPEDRAFSAHAFLRAREPAQALRARWPDLERPLPAGEVKAFAEEALLALGWEDEARTHASPANVQALLALLEGGHAGARAWIEERLASGPVEEVFQLMRRSHGLQERAAREVVASACRRRAEVERRAGAPTVDWEVNAALLSLGRDPYPEREADVALLLGVANGPWRVERPPRWILSLRALGSSEHPQGRAALLALEQRMAEGTTDGDRRDRAMTQAALLAGGDWSQEPAVRGMAQQSGERFGAIRASYEIALLHRWSVGDTRAAEGLSWLWTALGAEDGSVRERLARQLLLDPQMPASEVPVESMLRDLEAPDADPGLAVLAHAYRLRRGQPGARETLVRWLAGRSGGLLLGEHPDPERALAPPIAGFRALYLYD